MHTIPPDTPSLLEPKDVLSVRDGVLQWLGVHSWALRLGKAEGKMLTRKQLTIHEERYQEFCDNYTAGSLHQLHHDIYMALKRHLGKSLMVSHLFHQVTTETSNCASAFWDLLLQTFPPSSPQVVACLIAAAAASIMRGYFFYSDLILVLTRFLFYPYCYSRCWRLSSYSLSKGRLLYSFIFVHIS